MIYNDKQVEDIERGWTLEPSQTAIRELCAQFRTLRNWAAKRSCENPQKTYLASGFHDFNPCGKCVPCQARGEEDP